MSMPRSVAEMKQAALAEITQVKQDMHMPEQSAVDIYHQLNQANLAQNDDGSFRVLNEYRSGMDVLKDVGVTGLGALNSAGQAVLGIGDFVSLGHFGKAVESLGYSPKDVSEKLNSLYSESMQRSMNEFEAAEGFMGAIKAYVANPSLIAKDIGVSAGSLVVGGGIGKGLSLLGKAAPLVSKLIGQGGLRAGALGEGGAITGNMLEELRGENADGLVTGKDIGLSALTGALGTVAGIGGGKLANRLGVEDIDAVMARGSLAALGEGRLASGMAKKVLVGGGVEGLEEIPQEGIEQALTNVAQDKPMGEGVGKAMASGLVVGHAQGTIVNAMSGVRDLPKLAGMVDTLKAEKEAGPPPSDLEENTENKQKAEILANATPAETLDAIVAEAHEGNIDVIRNLPKDKLWGTEGTPIEESIGYQAMDKLFAEKDANPDKAATLDPVIDALEQEIILGRAGQRTGKGEDILNGFSDPQNVYDPLISALATERTIDRGKVDSLENTTVLETAKQQVDKLLADNHYQDDTVNADLQRVSNKIANHLANPNSTTTIDQDTGDITLGSNPQNSDIENAITSSIGAILGSAPGNNNLRTPGKKKGGKAEIFTKLNNLLNTQIPAFEEFISSQPASESNTKTLSLLTAYKKLLSNFSGGNEVSLDVLERGMSSSKKGALQYLQDIQSGDKTALDKLKAFNAAHQQKKHLFQQVLDQHVLTDVPVAGDTLTLADPVENEAWQKLNASRGTPYQLSVKTKNGILKPLTAEAKVLEDAVAVGEQMSGNTVVPTKSSTAPTGRVRNASTTTTKAPNTSTGKPNTSTTSNPDTQRMDEVPPPTDEWEGVNGNVSPSEKSQNEQPDKSFPTWHTLTVDDDVTLYRGEDDTNNANGMWWTTNKAKAAKYGKVTSITLPMKVVTKHAVMGHGGADEFMFVSKHPSELVTKDKYTWDKPIVVTSIKQLIELSLAFNQDMLARHFSPERIQEAQKNIEHYANILRGLEKLGIPFTNIKVSFSPEVKNNKGREVLGVSFGKQHRMLLNTGSLYANHIALPIQVILHEFVHELTTQHLDKYPALNKEITKLIDAIKAHDKTLLVTHGITNNKEFLAVLMASVEFQEVTNQIPIEGKLSLLDRAKKVFDALLKRVPATQKTVLTKGLSVAYSVMTAGQTQTAETTTNTATTTTTNTNTAPTAEATASVEEYKDKSKFTEDIQGKVIYLAPALGMKNNLTEVKNALFDLLDTLAENKQITDIAGGMQRMVEGSAVWHPFSVLADFYAGRYDTKVDKVMKSFKNAGLTEDELSVLRDALLNRTSPYSNATGTKPETVKETQETVKTESNLVSEKVEDTVEKAIDVEEVGIETQPNNDVIVGAVKNFYAGDTKVTNSLGAAITTPVDVISQTDLETKGSHYKHSGSRKDLKTKGIPIEKTGTHSSRNLIIAFKEATPEIVSGILKNLQKINAFKQVFTARKIAGIPSVLNSVRNVHENFYRHIKMQLIDNNLLHPSNSLATLATNSMQVAQTLSTIITKQYVKHNDTASKNAQDLRAFQDYLQLMGVYNTETGGIEFDPNLLTTIGLHAAEFLATEATGTLYRTNEQINRSLGAESNVSLPYGVYDYFYDKGAMGDTLYRAIGDRIWKGLNLKVRKNATSIETMDMRDRAIISLGQAAVHAMAQANYLEVTYVPIKVIKFIEGILTDGLPENVKWQSVKSEIDRIAKASIDDRSFVPFFKVSTDSIGKPIPSIGELIEGRKENTKFFKYVLFGEKEVDTSNYLTEEDLENIKHATHAGTGQNKYELSKIQKDNVAIHDKQPLTADTATMTAYSALDEDSALMIAGYDHDVEKAHITKMSGIRGKNNQLLRNRIALQEMLVDMDQRIKDGKSTLVYLANRVISNGRIMHTSRGINPQATKLHRFTMAREAWAQTISTKRTKTGARTKGTVAMDDRFHLFVAMGLGLEPSKKGTGGQKGIVNTFKDTIAHDPIFVAGVAAISEHLVWQEDKQSYRVEGKFTAEENAAIVATVKQYGENAHTLMVMSEYASYQLAVASGKDSFVSHIHAEIDGKTNGVCLGLAQFGTDLISPDLETREKAIHRLARVGISLDPYSTNNMDEFLQTADDTYEAGTKDVHNTIQNLDSITKDIIEEFTGKPIPKNATLRQVRKEISSIKTDDYKGKNAALLAVDGLFLRSGYNKLSMDFGKETATPRAFVDEYNNVTKEGRNIMKFPIMVALYNASAKRIRESISDGFIESLYKGLNKATEANVNIITQGVVELAQQAGETKPLFMLLNKEGRFIKTLNINEVFANKQFAVLSAAGEALVSRAVMATEGYAINAVIEDQYADVQLASQTTNNILRSAAIKAKHIHDVLLAAKIKQLRQSNSIPAMYQMPVEQYNKFIEEISGIFPTVKLFSAIQEGNENQAARFPGGTFESQKQNDAIDGNTTAPEHLTHILNTKVSSAVAPPNMPTNMHSVNTGLRVISYTDIGVAGTVVLTQNSDAFVASGNIGSDLNVMNQHDGFNVALNKFKELSTLSNTNIQDINLNHNLFQEVVDGASVANTAQEKTLTVEAIQEFGYSLDEATAMLADIKERINVDKNLKTIDQNGEFKSNVAEVTDKMKEFKPAFKTQVASTNNYTEETGAVKNEHNPDNTLGSSPTGLNPQLILDPVSITSSAINLARMADPALATVSGTINPASWVDTFKALLGFGTAGMSATHVEYLSSLIGRLQSTLSSNIKFERLMLSNNSRTAGLVGIRNGNNGVSSVHVGISTNDTTTSAGETMAHEFVHVTTEAGIRTRPELYKALEKLLAHVLANGFTYDKLLPPNANPIQIAEAQKLFDYFTKFGDNFGRSKINGMDTVLAEFTAFGVTKESVVNALKQMPTTRSMNKGILASFKGNNIQEKLVSLFDAIVEAIVGKAINTNKASNAHEELLMLVDALARVEHKAKGKWFDKLKSADNFYNKGINSAENKVKSLLANIPISKNGVTTGELAGALSKTVKTNLTNIIRSERTSIVSTIMQEARGTYAMRQPLDRLFAKYKQLIDSAVLNIMRHISINLLSKFNKRPTIAQRQLLTKSIVHTDVSSLLGNGYTIADIERMVDNRAELNNDIKTRLDALRANETIKTNWLDTHCKALGFFMITGRSTVDILGRNAAAIALSVKKYATTNPDSIQHMDALISLYALKYSSRESLSNLSEMIKSEPDAVKDLMYLHKKQAEEAYTELFQSNPLSVIKGYAPIIADQSQQLVYAPESRMQELINDGFTMLNETVKRDSQDFSGTKDPIRIFTMSNKYGNDWQSGACQSITEKRNTFDVGGTLDPAMGNTITTAALKDSVHTIHNAKLKNSSQYNTSTFDPRNVTDNFMVPTFGNDMRILGYGYSISTEHTDAYLNPDTTIDKILGRMEATLATAGLKEQSNKELVDVLNDIVAADKAANNGRINLSQYTVIGPGSTNEYAQEVWAKLPREMVKYIQASNEHGVILVPNELATMAFGERKYSLTEILNIKGPDRKFYHKAFISFFNTIFPKHPAAKKIRTVEAVMRELTGMAKNIIVVKTFFVSAANFMSNLLHLRTKGISFIDIIRDSYIAGRQALEYQRLEGKFIELDTEVAIALSSGDSQRADRLIEKRNRVESKMAGNPVKGLLDAGMLQTIVDDVDVSEEGGGRSFMGPISKTLSHMSNKLQNSKEGRFIDNAVRIGFLAEGTGMHSMLSNAAKLTDFTSRYVLYKHMTSIDRGTKRMSHDEALSYAANEFIDFNLPTHRMLQFYNDIGLVWFSKYFIRIQKVIATTIAEHPARALSTILTAGALDLSVIFDTVPFIARNPMIMLADPFTKMIGAIPELFSINAVMYPFK